MTDNINQRKPVLTIYSGGAEVPHPNEGADLPWPAPISAAGHPDQPSEMGCVPVGYPECPLIKVLMPVLATRPGALLDMGLLQAEVGTLQQALGRQQSPPGSVVVPWEQIPRLIYLLNKAHAYAAYRWNNEEQPL